MQLRRSTRPYRCARARCSSTSTSRTATATGSPRRSRTAWIRPRILLTSSDTIDVSPRRFDNCGAVAFVPKTELATIELTGLLR